MNNIELINKYKEPLLLENCIKFSCFNDFFKYSSELLDLHQIDFKYQRKNCKRSGAAILKINRVTGERKYTLMIDPESKDHAKMNIFIHELMHILLDHHVPKAENKYYLPTKAREFVVDYLAETAVYSLTGKKSESYQNEYKQAHNSINYRQNWIQSARISPKTIAIIEFQISEAINLLHDFYKEQNE